MSEEQLKAFLEAVKADAGLQEKLKEAGNAEAVVAIAKAAGFAVSFEDLAKAQAELSEGELEDIAGGETGWSLGQTCPVTWNCQTAIGKCPSQLFWGC
jgi:predicted ribosomally synthesized peptide with nif11-like leader